MMKRSWMVIAVSLVLVFATLTLTMGPGFNSYTLETAPTAADTTLIYDASAAAVRQTTLPNLTKGLDVSNVITGTLPVARGGTGVTTSTGSGANVLGTSPDFTTGATIGSVAIPTISSTNTLTNKSISLTNNTVTATSAELATAITDETGTGAAVFATSPNFASGITIAFATVPTNSSISTLTNKSISLATNTITGSSNNLRSALSDESGTGTIMTTNGAISGGTVNNSVIGGTTAAAITGTLVTANAGAVINNGATSGGFLDIYEDTDAGANKSRFITQAQAGDITYTLPADDGDAGEQLQTDGSGVMSWEAAGSTTLSASGTLDFASSLGEAKDLTLTVTGAALNDVVALGIPNGSMTASGIFFAWVSATDTVTVRFIPTSIGGENPASGTFKVKVFQ